VVGGFWQRVVVQLRLLKINNGPPRTRWDRIFDVQEDSSGREALAGSLYVVLLIVLVAPLLFRGPVWLRLVAAFSCTLFLVNLGVIVRSIVRRSRRGRGDAKRAR
jgi:hypothetical protein